MSQESFESERLIPFHREDSFLVCQYRPIATVTSFLNVPKHSKLETAFRLFVHWIPPGLIKPEFHQRESRLENFC